MCRPRARGVQARRTATRTVRAPRAAPGRGVIVMANLRVRQEERAEPVVRGWDPIRGMDPIRMLRDFFGADPFAGLAAPAGGVFAPDIEIKETKDAYVIDADLPGVREQDVEVSV